MLVSWNGNFILFLIWSLDPVPSSVSMLAKTPGIAKAALIGRSTAEADHHSCCTSSKAHGCRVIDSDLWLVFSTIELDPRKWSLFDAEAPYVVYSFLTSVTTKNEKVWLRKYDGMAISSSGCGAYDWDDHPLSLILSVSHIKKVEIKIGRAHV